MAITASKSKLLQLIAGHELAPSTKDICFEGLEFDSREIRGGELFLALPGEKAHGNSFITVALDRGAALVLADSRVALELGDLDIAEHRQRIILVSDPLHAFWQLASWWREELNLPTLAITGSVGKTTVKEICARILLQSGPGCYSLKSHNNHVGVPYTICRSTKQHQWLILEIGMNNRGEIARLSDLARPNVAVITAIAPAHVGNLGSLEIIEDEKLDIVSGLVPSGALVLNAADVNLFKKAAKLNKKFIINSFAVSPHAPETVTEVLSLGLEGIKFKLQIDDKVYDAKMSCLGRQNAQNAACASVACRTLLPNLTAQQILTGLDRFTAPLMRLNLKKLSDGSNLIDDSYNANPASMAAAIELVFDLAKATDSVALILGDMLELGSFSEKYHLEIASIIAKRKPKLVIAIGDYARLYLKDLPTNSEMFRHFDKAELALEFLSKHSFEYALIKASRGIGLEQVVKYLLELRGEEQFSV
jgi:UDP-N-acetylmuramoyl-tripeptide--D-alanyl-D-alanine ligase